jgi:hypothetical protein
MFVKSFFVIYLIFYGRGRGAIPLSHMIKRAGNSG